MRDTEYGKSAMIREEERRDVSIDNKALFICRF